MFATDQYQLLDFGAGRKLERFGPCVLDRPSPAAAEAEPCRPELWSQAVARYQPDRERGGHWSRSGPLDDAWPVACGALTLEVKLTDSGQTGLFPEQAPNWRWIAEQLGRLAATAKRRLQVLNLFAYTGASTLAAAAAGAEVVHVDAATSAVEWARRNAHASQLHDLPVRWMIEDAARFVRRELKRGHRYDAVILDPPAYGHGPRGESWKLDEHLGGLLSDCVVLCQGQPKLILLTCHSGRLGRARDLQHFFTAHAPEMVSTGTLTSAEMWLDSLAGRRLHCGAAVRWSCFAA